MLTALIIFLIMLVLMHMNIDDLFMFLFIRKLTKNSTQIISNQRTILSFCAYTQVYNCHDHHIHSLYYLSLFRIDRCYIPF